MPEPSPAAPRRVVDLARGRVLELRRPLVMGILNVTPDSFSDGGRLDAADPAGIATAAGRLLAEGADLLDVGGESTRPGHKPVPAAEELRRVVPAITAIRAAHPDCVISVDTRKSDVARAALAAGADLVNDVSGLADPAMAEVVRHASCAVVLMRNAPLHGDVVAACSDELRALVLRARAAGLRDAQLVVDPGLGFGDPPGGDPTAMLRLVRNVPAWSQGLPALVGASRKRAIGTLTGVAQPDARVAGSVAAALLAVQHGAAMVRVHDVAATVQALRVWTA